LGVNKTGKVAARALILYFSTTAMAVILGLILVATIKPGTLTNNTPPPEETNLDAAKLNTADTFLDLFRNLVPDNMIEMGFLMYASEAKAEYKKINVTNLTTTDQGLLGITN
jgi:Na+/H+-dicarboxylate symporter